MLPVLLLLGVQQWNSNDARALVSRAIERRRQVEAELVRYSSRAHGMVLFEAQVGAEPDAPFRLIKADELEVEVYWEAPNRSKQTVTAWRERRFLPTDIEYHRDHLGVVTDDFGDRIRLGEGDEVRDVPHPLSPSGPADYEYALGDSLSLASGTERLMVRELLIRPRDPSAPRAVGTLYLDVRTAALVRFRFSFTGAAYRQAQLEDITVVLERALFEQRHWLPWRQEIEIRRSLSWLNFPVRTVIRGRWEIGGYDLATAPAPERLAGGPYGGLRAPRADTGWADPLDTAIGRLEPHLPRADLDQARAEAARLISAAARSRRPPAQLAFGSVSDLAQVNRVQGLALGIGGSLNPGAGPLTLTLRGGYGFSSERLTGGGRIDLSLPPFTLSLDASRSVRDLSDWPTISGVLNSVLAQEGGHDYRDWLELDRVAAGLAWQRGAITVSAEAAKETPRSLEVTASPAGGEYRPNPPLGSESSWVGRLMVDGDWRHGNGGRVRARLGFEGGEEYLRATIDGGLRLRAGPGDLEWTVRGGWAGSDAPDWRTFALGGRGTLPGEPYRAWGGRRMALARVEWWFPFRLPSPRMESWIQAGSESTFAPFVAIGWSDQPVEGLPWAASDGLRPVLGVASELLFNVVRVEAGWAPRAGRVSILLDASPSWWPVL